jgi:hypothetical protein
MHTDRRDEVVVFPNDVIALKKKDKILQLNGCRTFSFIAKKVKTENMYLILDWVITLHG